MRRITIITCALLFFFKTGTAQHNHSLSSSQIHDKIKKLNFLGTVLYVAAHPDDENTTLISYLSNHTNARTAYLSLTRGDGGQNLIGPELREQLGILRTQELLAARNVDGGEQFFTRANDFGYSKHPDETLAIWNKKEVLADVVWTIRKFRPDVIINRFNHRNPGTTHGHHTASAMLSLEAFDLSANQTIYPEQLEYHRTWQPKRILFNTSWWFYGSREKFKKADKSNLISMDAGVYYPSKGLSNNEISAMSRSQHKCQGFGRLSSRGSQTEYLEHLKGDFPKNNDLFHGINTSWTRLKGGAAIESILKNVETNFNFQNPSKHIPDLLKAYQLINALEDPYWKDQKSKEIKDIIEACGGLFMETISNDQNSYIGSTIQLTTEFVKRFDVPLKIESIVLKNNSSSTTGINIQGATTPEFNTVTKFKKEINLNDSFTLSTPYWLTKKGSIGMYDVAKQENIGLPESKPSAIVDYNLLINNTPITFSKAVVYKYANPAVGEIYEPFHILPEVSTSLTEKMYIFNNNDSKKVDVIVRAGKDAISGTVQLSAPKNWTVTPKEIPYLIKQKGAKQTLSFTVTPPQEQNEGIIKPIVQLNGKNYSKELIEINYDHIPKQSVLLDAEAKIVKLNIRKKGQLIGYIKGSGDVTPESLNHMGYDVETIDLSAINKATLAKYDAIVVGIRAYNVLENIQFKQELLFDYIFNGGNMIVQYNTSHRLKVKELAPYQLKLSRDRVTNEFAEVKFLAPEHAVLNTPNKITSKDFDGWVQERGLYFPNKWGKEFTPILSMKDKGESAKKGSLLVASYGKGHYVYTGLSFFREFPSGVSGAYRLFANLLSLGK